MIRNKTMLFDVETTGLKPESSNILSIGAVIIDRENKEPDKEFYAVLDWSDLISNFYIPEDTISVHGIDLNRMKKEGKRADLAFIDFFKFIEDNTGFGSESILKSVVAFNLSFDMNMIRANLLSVLKNRYSDNIQSISSLLKIFTKDENDEVLFIDSMTYDRLFNFEVDGVKVRHNIEDVGRRYGLEENEDAHNALEDTKRLAELYKLQLSEMKERGLEEDSDLERRLINSYNRHQERFGKGRKYLDYLGLKVGITV